MKPVVKTLILLVIGLLYLEARSSLAVSGKQPDKFVAISFESPAGSQNFSGDLDSTATHTTPPISTDSAALLQEIQDLTAQRRTDLLPTAPGWLHIIIRRTQSKVDPLFGWNQSSGQLPLEQWLSLDNQGRIHADIRRILNDQWQASELNLLTGGKWIVLPLARFSTLSSTLPFDPNYGIYERFAHLIQQGQALNKSTIYKECWYQGEKYTTSDGRIIHEVLFMPDDHGLRWIKTWQVSSGVITLVDSLEIILEERLPLPPDDVFAHAPQAAP